MSPIKGNPCGNGYPSGAHGAMTCILRAHGNSDTSSASGRLRMNIVNLERLD
jgi:hypothetical protein